MPEAPQQRETAIRAALREITAEYGRDALSSPATMSNLVKDLLPDDQQIARILVAAAEQQIPDALREHVSQGMDIATATQLVASSLAASTLFAQQACAWVVSELAVALGLGSSPDLGAASAPAVQSDSSAGALRPTHTAPTLEVAQSEASGTVPAQPQASGPGPPEVPVAQHLAATRQLRGDRRASDDFEQERSSHDRVAPDPARRRRSRLTLAVLAILAVSASVIILLTQQGHGNPQSSPAAPPGTHPVNREIINGGSLIVTLTTIRVHQDVMTVDVAYHNVTPTSQPLDCSGYGDPSIVTVSLANGTVLHATETYCSDHPNLRFTVRPGAVHISYAIFAVTGSFPQPFSFHWPYGNLSGSVSGIRI